mgnify:CR=1 FL=1
MKKNYRLKFENNLYNLEERYLGFFWKKVKIRGISLNSKDKKRLLRTFQLSFRVKIIDKVTDGDITHITCK